MVDTSAEGHRPKAAGQGVVQPPASGLQPPWWPVAIIGWLAIQATAFAADAAGVRVWLPEAITTTGPAIDRLFYIILWITGVVFVLVQATLLWFLVRYRRRPGRPAAYTHGNALIEVVWTVIPSCILVWLAVQNQRVWSAVHRLPPSPDFEVEVSAQQFEWHMRYPGADGRLRTDDDVVAINQLHLPVNQTILLHVRSNDVIHSFFVPQFRLKRDAVPGLTGRLWLSATKTGRFEIACAELCGLGHYRMRGFLVIETPDEVRAWLAQKLAEQQS
jgi:cytochrome c oxidase subunit 2